MDTAHQQRDAQNAQELERNAIEELIQRETEIEALKTELETVKAQLHVETDKSLRLAADFQNLRRRTEQQRFRLREEGQEELLKDLLPLFDDMDRSLTAAGKTSFEPESPGARLRDGVEMVHRNMLDLLKRIGVEPIQAVGQPFDENLHEAVSQMATEHYAPGVVIAEAQKGYRFGERVLRYAQVIVSA